MNIINIFLKFYTIPMVMNNLLL